MTISDELDRKARELFNIRFNAWKGFVQWEGLEKDEKIGWLILARFHLKEVIKAQINELKGLRWYLGLDIDSRSNRLNEISVEQNNKRIAELNHQLKELEELR